MGYGYVECTCSQCYQRYKIVHRNSVCPVCLEPLKSSKRCSIDTKQTSHRSTWNVNLDAMIMTCHDVCAISSGLCLYSGSILCFIDMTYPSSHNQCIATQEGSIIRLHLYNYGSYNITPNNFV